jgi:hypothetical protein
MMWSQVRGNWQRLGDQMHAKWAKLSHLEIEQIAGRRPALIALLQERYEIDEREATSEADGFVRSLQVLSL